MTTVAPDIRPLAASMTAEVADNLCVEPFRFGTCSEQLVIRLMQIAEDGSDADGLRAISMLLDRLYGKPKETVETAQPEAELRP